MPSCFHSDPHLDSSLLQFAIKLFGFAVLVQQPSFAILSTLVFDKRDLLETRMIIQSYNQHVRLLPPELWLVFASTKFTQVDGADVVMKSSGNGRELCTAGTTGHGRIVCPLFKAFLSPIQLDMPEQGEMSGVFD